jgi:hypothetical protein
MDRRKRQYGSPYQDAFDKPRSVPGDSCSVENGPEMTFLETLKTTPSD